MRPYRTASLVVCLALLHRLWAEEKKAEAAAPAAVEPAGEVKSEGAEPDIPDELLEDEHLREEYGVNKFTTPSIRKIFSQLDQLGALPYEKLRREIPKVTPHERTQVALALGVLIGDGFLSVQTEKVSDLEDVGRAVLKHAKVLSAGARVTEHARSLLQSSTLGDWKSLREELASTQKDVESEMILLRDMEIAHFIAMGGWIRGLEIATGAALDPFTPERAAVLARLDLAEYFAVTLADLDPKFAKLDHIKKLRQRMDEVRALVDMPEGKIFGKAQVEKLHGVAAEMVKLITTVK